MNAKSLLETTMNTRELGGYLTAFGNVTLCSRLLRSDEPLCPDSRDIAYLLKERITTIIDLRGKQEMEKRPNPFADMPGFFYRNIPIEEGGAIPESTAAVPGSYLAIAGAANSRQVYQCIAHAPEGVLFHCAAGKDRTGVVSAVLLLLVGVCEEDIIENYMLTKEYNQKRFLRARQSFPNIDINIIIPHEEYMRKFLHMFRAAYGDARQYLENIGLPESEVRLIVHKLTYNADSKGIDSTSEKLPQL